MFVSNANAIDNFVSNVIDNFDANLCKNIYATSFKIN